MAETCPKCHHDHATVTVPPGVCGWQSMNPDGSLLVCACDHAPAPAGTEKEYHRMTEADYARANAPAPASGEVEIKNAATGKVYVVESFRLKADGAVEVTARDAPAPAGRERTPCSGETHYMGIEDDHCTCGRFQSQYVSFAPAKIIDHDAPAPAGKETCASCGRERDEHPPFVAGHLGSHSYTALAPAAQEACPKCGRGLPHLAPCEWYLECDRKKPPAPARMSEEEFDGLCQAESDCGHDRFANEARRARESEAALRERAEEAERGIDLQREEIARRDKECDGLRASLRKEKDRKKTAEADRERLREALQHERFCGICSVDGCDDCPYCTAAAALAGQPGEGGERK